MTEAIRASIIVLLFIAAIAIIIAVVRSGGKSGGVFTLDSTKTNSTMAATETNVDGEAAVRRIWKPGKSCWQRRSRKPHPPTLSIFCGIISI